MRRIGSGAGRWVLAAAVAVVVATGVRAAETTAPEPDPMAAFPAALDGQVRYVVRMPAQEDEAALKVELVVGKTQLLDNRNRYFFIGQLEEVDIPGWGYNRYVLKELGALAGTLMAPPPGEPKVERFVSLGGEPRLLRYNSRLPIVVYVPEGVEVRYRIWAAGAAEAAAKE